MLCLLLFFQPPLPAAHFNGKIHTVTKSAVTVDTDEGNEVEFTITRKTKVERDGKSIELRSLQTGEQVSIEAHQELRGYFIALKVIATGSSSAH